MSLLILRRRLGRAQGWRTLRSLGKVLVASVAIGIAIVGVLLMTRGANSGALWMLVMAGTVGVVTYVLAGLLLKIESLHRLPALLLSKSSQKTSELPSYGLPELWILRSATFGVE